MIIIKSYTDLEQSRKLAEILPHESADMYYSSVPVREWKDKEDKSKGTHIIFKDQIFALENLRSMEICEGDTYAWSLAALLDVLQKTTYFIDEDANVILSSYKTVEWDLGISNSDGELTTKTNPVDACYGMILRLHEQGLL